MSNFNYHQYKSDREMSIVSPDPEKPEGEGSILESAWEPNNAIDLADAQVRSMAMSAVLSWVDAGGFTFEDMDELLVGITDLDGDEVLDDQDFCIYEDIWPAVADATLSLGADPENVKDFIDGNETAGEKLGGFLTNVMDNMPATDDEIITTFATGDDGAVFECAANIEDMEDAILEAVYKKAKVVRDGKVVVKKKRISGRVRLSAAQKKGLKKARRKANTAAAKVKKDKSIRRRQSRGM